jgi:AraC-like DNA-binding protein
MPETSEVGILYTERSDLTALTPVSSLWSYETRAREPGRPAVAMNPNTSFDYWLDRSDPLLNTMLPGTGISVIVNLGDDWRAGSSLAASRLLPRVCVVGPVSQVRILRVGHNVRAVGAVIPTALTEAAFGVPAAELIDRIVPLSDLWSAATADRFLDLGSTLGSGACLTLLRDSLVAQIGRTRSDAVGLTAAQMMIRCAGRVSIDHMAKHHGLSRRQFTRRFSEISGLTPKRFARISRFQKLVQVLLSTDVQQWASVPSAVGFYDQAHMINEFRRFAGSSPTTFFRPHSPSIDPTRVRLRGRPSEWLRPSDSTA